MRKAAGGKERRSRAAGTSGLLRHTGAARTILMAAVLSLGLSFEGQATPEFGRSAEEWAMLRDNTMEWREIDELVKEYNPTVLSNQYEFQKSEQRDMSAQEVRSYLSSQADDYDAMAVDTEGISGMQMAAANYRIQAESLRSSALDSTEDSSTIRIGYEKMELTLRKSVRESFIAYYTALAEKEYQESQLGYLNAQLQSAQTRRSLGMATELDVLTAQENVQKAAAALHTKEAEIEKCRKSMITACGWKYDALPVIGELPQPDLNYVQAADPAADMEKALQMSCKLRQDQIRLQNSYALSTQVSDRAARQLESDRNSAEISLRSAYDSMITGMHGLQNAVAAHEMAISGLLAKQREYQNGSASRMELLAAEDAERNAALASKRASGSLLSQILNYQYMLEGLAE